MLAPGTPIGRYVIKRKLAEGGMAEIFLATATGPEGFEKEVAIKVVRSFLASDQSFVDMFVAEARLASKLNHANIVQIFDFGKHEDRYYLAMEFVRGASLFDLKKRCQQQGTPFPPTLAGEVVAQTARGLQFAHALREQGRPLGLVHRDVTPQNILLSFDGAVKLTDFGIAKATSSQTAPGMLKGKFAYMSPEQARGEQVDARTDIFALGIVLWELLTGGRLFTGESEMAVLRSVQNCIIVPPSRLNPEVPQELSDLVLKALQREPADRYQSAFEFERALSGWVIKTAQTVEDTSIAIYVQGLYREEYEADRRQVSSTEHLAVARRTEPAHDAIVNADTMALPRDEAAAGAGLAATHPSGRLPHLDEAPSRPDDETLKPGTPPPKVRTEQMPSLRNLPRVGSERATPASLKQPTSPERPSAFVGPLEDEPASDGTEPMPALQQRGATGASTAAPTDAPPPQADAAPPQTLPAPEPRRLNPLVVTLIVLVCLAGVGGVVMAFVSPGGSEAGTDPTPPEPLALATPPVDGPRGPTPPAVEAPPDTPPAVVKPPREETPKPAAEVKPPEPAADPPKPKDPPKPAVDVPDERVATLDLPGDDTRPRTTKKPADTAAKVKATGTLTVRAQPYALVTVGHRKAVEVVGKYDFTLPAGTWTVVLEHPKKNESTRVTVRAGQTATLDFKAF